MGASGGTVARAAGAARDGGVDESSDREKIDNEDYQNLCRAVERVVCSEYWRDKCVSAVVHGEVKHKPADRAQRQAKELHRRGVYPPGGNETRMVRCCRCCRWTPKARLTRERTVTKLPNGQVRTDYSPFEQLCIDCYYCDLPLLEAVFIPSSPGFSTRIKDADVAAHFGVAEGPDGKPHVNGGIRRRRYLHADGTVREPFKGDDGFLYENVYDVTAPPAVGSEAA